MTSSFEQFFRENYRTIVGRLVGRGCEAGLAAECAQEAFVRAYARWPLLHLYRDPVAWVVRVARNLEIDEHRRSARNSRRTAELAAVAARADDPAEEVAKGLDLHRAISDLPAQQRRATELFYLRDTSTSEGASQLGITGGAFRFHLTRARSALRLALDPPEANPTTVNPTTVNRTRGEER